MFSAERDLNGPVVLIVADHPAFAQSLVGRWQQESAAPTFTVLTSATNGIDPGHYAGCHLAIVEAAALPAYRSVLQRLNATGVPIICALPVSGTKNGHRNNSADSAQEFVSGAARLRSESPRLLVVPCLDPAIATETLLLFATEVLRRIEASLRAKRSEVAAGSQAAQLALGRYVAESMHSFNNAMTAVLGNAELLMLDPEALSADMREQVEAVHSNAIRLHEMMQRFFSLQAEMNASKKEGRSAAAVGATQAYLSGT